MFFTFETDFHLHSFALKKSENNDSNFARPKFPGFDRAEVTSVSKKSINIINIFNNNKMGREIFNSFIDINADL